MTQRCCQGTWPTTLLLLIALGAAPAAAVLLLLLQLDAGVSEQVLLQSRDERSLLVVSYADIKVGSGGFRRVEVG